MLDHRITTLSAMMCALLAACAPGSPGGDLAFEDEGDVRASPLFAGDPANDAVFALDLSFWEGPMSQKEMDCFWDSGVRHLVSGTQVEEITRQQLEMAVSRGMTVDAYVYLYWGDDITEQVDRAFARTSGFPIGRMWLDIEEQPSESTNLEASMAEAIEACRAHDAAECGVYTGPGYWKTYTANSTSLADAPLWYALYNHKTRLSDWPTEKFGGWAAPAAKQFAEEVICNVGADKDVMQVITSPTVVVDRTLPPDTGAPPPAPGNLYPRDGSVVALDYVKIMSATIPRATSYQLALERWNGTAFGAYYTWTNANAFKKVTPSKRNSLYRFRARARNAHGWGPWSSYVSFDFGTYVGPRPGAPADPPPEEQAQVPGSLSPDGGMSVPSGSVTLRCSAVTGAASYDFEIESASGGSFVPYVTYQASSPAKTFWPQIHGPYRWRVRARVNGAAGPWSSHASFTYP